jgi:hypothetical protein
MGMNWFKKSNISYTEAGVFTPDFISKINKAYLDFDQYNRQNVGKVEFAGTVEMALSHPLLRKDFENVLDVEIYFANKINGQFFSGFATGFYKNKDAVFLNPQQAGNDYIPGLIHELKHIQDKMKGKKVRVTPNMDMDKNQYREYRNYHSERSAREREKYYMDLLKKEKEQREKSELV